MSGFAHRNQDGVTHVDVPLTPREVQRLKAHADIRHMQWRQLFQELMQIAIHHLDDSRNHEPNHYQREQTNSALFVCTLRD